MNDARSRGHWQGMNWIRKDKRLAIYLRDGMACMYCASTMEDGSILTLDHVLPHSQGGSNREQNLITCCRKCNSVRGDRPVEEFAAAAAEYLDQGVQADDILSAIEEHVSLKLKPYRDEAKAILARRPSWMEAINACRA